MRVFGMTVALLTLGLAASPAGADDLAGASRCLCASVQATQCLEGGACTIDVPWNFNVPEFIEVDFSAKTLSTTKASGENRATPISHLSRADGLIVLQGFEKGRAFSLVITEATGRLSAAVATEGRSVAVFGSCTPLPPSPAPAK